MAQFPAKSIKKRRYVPQNNLTVQFDTKLTQSHKQPQMATDEDQNKTTCWCVVLCI